MNIDKILKQVEYSFEDNNYRSHIISLKNSIDKLFSTFYDENRTSEENQKFNEIIVTQINNVISKINDKYRLG